MSQLVYVDKDKCNQSFTCIRVCPAKAIKIADNHANVIASKCIGCGNCVMVCAQNAIEYRSEKQRAMDLLTSNEKVAALCDPSISGEFVDVSDYRKFIAMIRELGFDYVNEAAFGVDLVAIKYKELLDNFQGKYFFTTHCPPVHSFIQKYRPKLVENLAPLLPPHVAMSKVIHKKYGKGVRVVYLSSCIAAKDDVRSFISTDGKIDAVVSFVELRELFKEHGITERSVRFSDFDPPVGRKGGLYPIRRGLTQAADIQPTLLKGSVVSLDGREDFLQSINEFQDNASLHQHFDVYYCEGCIMGAGMSSRGHKFSRRSNVVDYVSKRLKVIDCKQWKADIAVYSELDLSRSFKVQDRRLAEPSSEEI